MFNFKSTSSSNQLPSRSSFSTPSFFKFSSTKNKESENNKAELERLKHDEAKRLEAEKTNTEKKAKESANALRSAELKKTERFNKHTYGFNNGTEVTYEPMEDLTNYDYIINIIDIIHLLLAKKVADSSLTTSFGGQLTKTPTIIENIQEKSWKFEFDTKFIDMKSTLSLLICAIAYIKNINLDDANLQTIYTNLLDIRKRDPDIAKRMRILVIFKEDNRQMKFLITLMGHIDAIMAKGESKYGLQMGLTGSAGTLNDVKEINYRLNPIAYLFGIHGGLLKRFLKKNNYTIGSSILKSQKSNFTNETMNNYLNTSKATNRNAKNTKLANLGKERKANLINSGFESNYALNTIGFNKNKPSS